MREAGHGITVASFDKYAKLRRITNDVASDFKQSLFSLNVAVTSQFSTNRRKLNIVNCQSANASGAARIFAMHKSYGMNAGTDWDLSENEVCVSARVLEVCRFNFSSVNEDSEFVIPDFWNKETIERQKPFTSGNNNCHRRFFARTNQALGQVKLRAYGTIWPDYASQRRCPMRPRLCVHCEVNSTDTGDTVEVDQQASPEVQIGTGHELSVCIGNRGI